MHLLISALIIDVVNNIARCVYAIKAIVIRAAERTFNYKPEVGRSTEVLKKFHGAVALIN